MRECWPIFGDLGGLNGWGLGRRTSLTQTLGAGGLLGCLIVGSILHWEIVEGMENRRVWPEEKTGQLL